VLTHAHVSMITYRVDVYRSKPIGASLLAGRGDGHQCGLDQVPHGRGNFLGKGRPIGLRSTVICAVGLSARVGQRNHVLDGASPVLRNVAMATNFGTKIAITGFV